MTKRIKMSLIAAMLTACLLWIGGMDFNERGLPTAWGIAVCFTAALSVFTCPLWKDEDK